MHADFPGSGDPAAADRADSDPDEGADASAGATQPDAPDEATEAVADADPVAEDLKAKYREALAHKHASHGATQSGHGDKGANAPGHDQAHGHRMFRRKSGG